MDEYLVITGDIGDGNLPRFALPEIEHFERMDPIVIKMTSFVQLPRSGGQGVVHLGPV